MRLLHRVLLIVLIGATIFPSFASRVRRGPTSPKHKLVKGKRTQAAARPRAIDDTRASEIQGALVKAGYLHEVSGHWDSESQAAMQKLQGDNGWQTKLIPDSRALIKLGLGPNAKSDGPSASTAPFAFTPAADRNGN